MGLQLGSAILNGLVSDLLSEYEGPPGAAKREDGANEDEHHKTLHTMYRQRNTKTYDIHNQLNKSHVIINTIKRWTRGHRSCNNDVRTVHSRAIWYEVHSMHLGQMRS